MFALQTGIRFPNGMKQEPKNKNQKTKNKNQKEEPNNEKGGTSWIS